MGHSDQTDEFIFIVPLQHYDSIFSLVDLRCDLLWARSADGGDAKTQIIDSMAAGGQRRSV